MLVIMLATENKANSISSNKGQRLGFQGKLLGVHYEATMSFFLPFPYSARTGCFSHIEWRVIPLLLMGNSFLYEFKFATAEGSCAKGAC